MFVKRLGYFAVIFVLWLGAARSQTEFSHSNYQSIDLTAFGLTGEITRIALSPDSRYAAVETRWENERHLYVVELGKKELLEVDPRQELEGYDVWKKSPIAKLYPRSDCEPQWYPDKRAGQQWLLFKSNGIDNQDDLFLFRPSTKSYVRVTESENGQRNAKWSPNGEYLSFQTQSDVSELYVVPNMGRIFNEVEKLQMAYNHIPSLADIYSSSIFDGSKDLFFSTRENIIDYDWLANGGIAMLQAQREDSTSARLYYLRSSGKAKFVEDVPGAVRVSGNGQFTNALVMTPVEEDGRSMWSVISFDEEDFNNTSMTRRDLGMDLGSTDITSVPRICGKDKFLLSFSGSKDDELDFRTYSKGRNRDRAVGIPLNGRILDIDIQRQDGKDNAFTVVGAYNALNRYGMFTFTFEYQLDEEDIPLMERKQFIEFGLQAHFSRYTGDVVTGDFQPGVGIWAELRFAEGLADFSAGAKLAYVPLTGEASNADVSFAAYFWAGEVYLKYTYPLSYEFQPYASFGVGVAASNSRQITPKEPFKRQTPFFFDFTGGAAFTLNPRMNMHVIASFVQLSEDIDRLHPKAADSDSYIVIGLGFSYTLSF